MCDETLMPQNPNANHLVVSSTRSWSAIKSTKERRTSIFHGINLLGVHQCQAVMLGKRLPEAECLSSAGHREQVDGHVMQVRFPISQESKRIIEYSGINFYGFQGLISQITENDTPL